MKKSRRLFGIWLTCVMIIATFPCITSATSDYSMNMTLNGYEVGANIEDLSVTENSSSMDFYDFNLDGTCFAIFEDNGGASDWSSTVTEIEADKDYWLVVALEKQGGGALLESQLDTNDVFLSNGCTDKVSVYDDDLWWVEFKLNRADSNATGGVPGVYSVAFDANGGTVSPTDALTSADGKLSMLPVPNPSSSVFIFDGWYTSLVDGNKVTLETVFTTTTTIYAHWTKHYDMTISLNGYVNGANVADLSVTENSDSLDFYDFNLDGTYFAIFEDNGGTSDWSSIVTELEADKDYWLVVALEKQGGGVLPESALAPSDVTLTNDCTDKVAVYDDDLWWFEFKLKPLEEEINPTEPETDEESGDSTEPTNPTVPEADNESNDSIDDTPAGDGSNKLIMIIMMFMAVVVGIVVCKRKAFD